MSRRLFRLDDATRPWWTLVGSCMGLFVLMLDSTVVALALPQIRTDLEVSRATLQWILNGYLLAIAAFVVSAGRLGDMFGRRRVFAAGLATFAAGMRPRGRGVERRRADRRPVRSGRSARRRPSRCRSRSSPTPSRRSAALRPSGIWTGVSSLALAIGPLAGGVARRRRLAADLLDQHSGLPRRARDHPARRRGRVATRRRAIAWTWPGSPILSVGARRAGPAARRVAAVGVRLAGDHRAARRRRGVPRRLLPGRAARRSSRSSTSSCFATGPYFGATRGGVRARRRLLGADAAAAAVPAGRSGPFARCRAGS